MLDSWIHEGSSRSLTEHAIQRMEAASVPVDSDVAELPASFAGGRSTSRFAVGSPAGPAAGG
jgi:hypothetical protein